jgi:hypothetical protein
VVITLQDNSLANARMEGSGVPADS